jgi:hypothetical protein
MAAAAAVAGTTVSSVSRALNTVKPLGNSYPLSLARFNASRRCSSMAAAGALQQHCSAAGLQQHSQNALVPVCAATAFLMST